MSQLTENVYEDFDADDFLNFELKDKDHTFTIGLGDVLQCLKFAESKGYIPKISLEWWDIIGTIYPGTKEDCPYLNNKRTNDTDDRYEYMTELNVNIYNTVKNYYDKIIYYISKLTGLQINKALAKSFLEFYINTKFYLYTDATMYNIPYVLLYAQPAFNIYGKKIAKDSKLYNIIKNSNKVNLIEENGYFRIDKLDDNFLNITMNIAKHRRTIENEELYEYMVMKVYIDGQEIGQEKIDINETQFLNLIEKNKDKYRKEDLLQLTESLPIITL